MDAVRALSLILVNALLFAVGCGTDDGGPVPDAGAAPDGGIVDSGCLEPTFTSIYSDLLNTPTCNPDGICHGNSATPSGGLNFKLDQATVHTALRGATMNAIGGAMFPSRIVADTTTGTASQSYFYLKLTRTDAPGGLMPLGSTMPLNAACYINPIRGWISHGAANN